jgi:hypothetical protein
VRLTAQSLRAAIEKRAKRDAAASQAADLSDVPGTSDSLAGPPAVPPVTDPPDDPAINGASAVLGRYGARLIRMNGEMRVGIWSWLDCPAVRDALKVMQSGGSKVIYLDDQSFDLPVRFKLCACNRRLDSDPVPAVVIEAMNQTSEKPWLVRDALLEEMGWRYWTVGRPGARTFDDKHVADRAVDRVVDQAPDRTANVPVVAADDVPDEGAANPAATPAASLLISSATKGHNLGALSASEIRWRRDNAARVFEQARQEGPAASIALAEREREEHERFEREQEQVRMRRTSG